MLIVFPYTNFLKLFFQLLYHIIYDECVGSVLFVQE